MGNISSCLGAGAEEGPHDPVTVQEVEVGLRCCFYWLSDDAERTLSPAERIKWMEESGKGECQDAAVTQTDFAGSTGSVFAGVFDGHGIGGRKAAVFAAGEVTRELAGDTRTHPDKINREWKAAVTDACVAAHAALSKPELAGCDAHYSGTTACMALVHGGQLFLANVGDSRAALGRLNSLGRIQGVPLTQDNKPEDPEEKRRIEKAGGMVLPMRNREGAFVGPKRVFGPDGLSPGLAMSRSLGDLLAHSLGVSPVPTCSHRRLTSHDQFVVLATDGVWEVMTCQEVAHFVQRWRKRPWIGWSASDALTLEAQERWKLLQPEIMVDDVAAIVIMLTPPPASAAPPKAPPKKAARAQLTNAAANSVEAKADRDALSSLPYQNFFRHLELERLDSTNASGRGGSHVRFEDRDRDDAPAPPGAGPAPSGADGGAALRRALSRNTIVPQSVYDGAASSSDGGGSAPAGTANGAATPAAGGGGAPSAAAAGGPAGAALSRETTVPRGGAYDGAAMVSASASGAAPVADVAAAAGPSGVEGLRPARSGLPRHPSRDNLPATAFSPSAMQAYSRSPSKQTTFREMGTPPPSLGGAAGVSPWLAPPSGPPSPFMSHQVAAWAALDSPSSKAPRKRMARANSSSAVDAHAARHAALTTPGNSDAAVNARALSANSMLRPFRDLPSNNNLLRPIRKAYPSRDSLSGSPPADDSPLLDSPMRSEASTDTLDGRQHGGGGRGGSSRDAREGRVRGGISRMRSVPKDLHSVLGDQRTALPSRSKSTRVLRTQAANSPKAPIAASPLPMPMLAPPRPSFSNPFASSPVQAAGLNPWDESPADSASATSSQDPSYRGAQRGSSAALDMLRASPSSGTVLAHAYTAPVAAIMSAWSSSPPSMTEGSPLLEPGSADSTDAPLAAAAAAADNAPASPLPSVSEEEPSVHSAGDSSAAGLRGGSGAPGAVADSVSSIHPAARKGGFTGGALLGAHQKLTLHGVSCPPAAQILVEP
ncbi:g3277 [Coccomyxa elongata]